MREYIVPNWHAVLIHAPLGLLAMGVILELITFPWRRSAARAAGRWMILLGVMAAVPALTSGVYAFRDAIVHNTTGDDAFDQTWATLRARPVPDYAAAPSATAPTVDRPTRPAYEMLGGEVGTLLRHHIWRNAFGTLAIFLAVVVFIGASDLWRRRLYLPLVVLLLAGEGLIVSGSHNGSLAVYQRGIAMEPEAAGRSMASMMAPTRQEQVKAYVPPAQLHMTMAGWVVSFALLSLALSIRAMTQGLPAGTTAGEEDWFEAGRAGEAAPPVVDDRDRAATALFEPAPDAFEVAADERREVRTALAGVSPRAPASTVTTVTTAPLPVVPSGRFWLLTVLAALLTAAGGLWLINVWTWPNLRAILEGENRNLYHAIGGATIIVLTLILAFLARFARRAKVVLGLFTLLLLAAVTFQAYVGILMTFDGPVGPKGSLVSPLHFNPPTAQ